MLPTIDIPYPGLRAVLDTWRQGVLDILGTDVVGIYIQGSFAVGDADEHSDCDFIVATRRDCASRRESLDALHEAIHALPHVPWHRKLEGSYAPVDILRRLTSTPRDPPHEPRPVDWADPGMSGLPARVYPFLYLDHGARNLVRSEHDNTQVVRWSLREKGIVLFGPDPPQLVDAVSHDDLRTEVRALLTRIAACRLEPLDTLYWRSFWIGLLCRISHTAETGTVASKKASARWGADAFDPEWRALIEQAQAVRDGRRSDSTGLLSAGDRRTTFAFAEYVFGRHAAPWPFAGKPLGEADHGPGLRKLSSHAACRLHDE